MGKADLPVENAFEPQEGAFQPQPTVESEMPPNVEPNATKKITFATNTAETTASQKSSSYREVLSQPDAGLSHRQRLVWLQKRRGPGLWAQCDECDTWRFLPAVLDRYELPNKWFCWMNPDKAFASCSIAECPVRVRVEEDLIHSEYSAGSLVWARLAGWPWWPAMVDDCPDAEQYYWLDGFSDIPTHYNVVFFDATEATRAWIAPARLKPYAANKKYMKNVLKNKTYESRLKAAVAQADKAEELTLPARLTKYSFIARHKGQISSPKKISKRDVKKYQKLFKTKFNMDIPIEDNSESDDDTGTKAPKTKRTPKRKNVIVLGNQKNKKNKTNNDNSDEIDLTTTEHEQQSKDIEEAQDLDNLRPLNSMVAQAGSTMDTVATESIDNDTSKTYMPESRTNEDISSPSPEITVTVDTLNSDDFDF